MRVELDGGTVIEIGATEAAPTIGIVDYSRRETDDFGVTTVVPRGFARTMSVRVKVDTDDVDAVQRQLAALRATPARWVADDRFDALSFTGFYKEFSLDLAIPPVSYCTLTIEGLAQDVAYPDPGTDPAPDHRASTLRLLQPVTVTDAVLVSSTIDEDDYPAWSGAATYALGARVMVAATHRIYESAADANAGNDPTASALWIDIGPTNRWAMFDQALGSLSEADAPIVVRLDPIGSVNAVALLDVTAATVRVEAAGYDRTQVVASSPGATVFLDLPVTVGTITVTIWGAGDLSVGTLLMGQLVGLGLTESSPTAAITDYSRKETDDFGEVTLVERAWAKRMSVRGLIDTAALDIVAGRIANVRALPSLWIGDDALESVTVYGFFKDFSIEVGENVSTLSLSIEGLSAAAKVAPIVSGDDITVPWENVSDPDGTKPDDNATVGAPDDTNVGDTPAQDVAASLKALGLTTDPAEIVSGAQALADAVKALALATSADDIVAGAQALVNRARSADMAALEQMILNQERRERFDDLTHMGGIPVGAKITEESVARVEGDEALASNIVTLEAVMTVDQQAVRALIQQEATARATADSAEALSREVLIAEVRTEMADGNAIVQSQIENEAIARANAIEAETEQRELAISELRVEVDGQIDFVSAAIASEAITRANADAAETLQRTQAISTLRTEVDGQIDVVTAAISTEATTRATADAAETEQREIAVSRIDSDMVVTRAAITSEASTRATADAAETLARQAAISTLQTADANLNAAIVTEATTRATNDAAETALREAAISSLQSTDAYLNAALTTELTTRATADAAEATARQALAATLTSDIADANAAIEDEATARATADLAETSARNTAISTLQTTVNGQISAAMAAITSEATTRASADLAETTARNGAISALTTTMDGHVTDLEAAIASEATTRATADAAETSQREAAISSLQSADAYLNAALTTEATTRASADAAEVTARQALAATLTSDIADVSAAVETEAEARVSADGALASLLSAVQTTVDGHTAEVLTLMESVDGLSARWGVRITRSGPGGEPVVSGVLLNDDGEQSDFSVLAERFRVVSNGTGDRYEFGDGRQVIIGGSVMTITGKPFGSTDQFIEWTGPIVSDLSECTQANAIKFVRVDGGAYFGGGLSSGTLKNEGTSSTISETAFIIVGPFASNGGPVNVNMSATFQHNYECSAGTGAITGSGGGTLTLEWSSDGAAWTFLTTIGVNESERFVRVDGDPSVRDIVRWAMSAAGTFTWTPGALAGVYIRLRWSSFSEPSLIGSSIMNTAKSQRTSVIAVEQP
ncbi:hypothetical protein [Sphingobium sp. YR768]|uniref:hypothetical protein n=1 Tax=Sphingobium sp. YR768 TaxID=1884365 RepID=UPI0008B5146B|nr:hypothetical protein [Sphingobium sp. YR768]SEQ60742.1 hypothetical protein SAMN05518866_101499 [Sphingobium sp. YR768]